LLVALKIFSTLDRSFFKMACQAINFKVRSSAQFSAVEGIKAIGDGCFTNVEGPVISLASPTQAATA
jgi:hypothetical protein